MLPRIGGYMPPDVGRSLQALLASHRRLQRTPHVKGCRAHIAVPATVSRNTERDLPVPNRTLTDRALVTDRCATDGAMNAGAAARDERLSEKDSPRLSQKSTHLDLPVLEKARRDRESP